MATLKYTDLAKKDSVDILLRRVFSAGFFQLKDEKSATLRCTKRIALKMNRQEVIYDEKNKLEPSLLKAFLKKKSLADSIEIELKFTQRTKKFVKVTELYKDKEFDGKSKAKTSMVGAERQELGLIEALKDIALRGVKLPGIDIEVSDVWKNEKRTVTGQEPYIDLFVKDIKNKTYGISCKGDFAPSLAGGGVAGLSRIAPRLVDGIYEKVESYLKNDLGISEGTIVPAHLVPDIFIPIPNMEMKKILIGNEYIGGPVDYMYVGKMDVSYSFMGQRVTLNGKFYDIESYMKKIGDFYFRVRKRELIGTDSIRVVYKEMNKEGYPVLFKNPVTNKPNFRLVIDSRVSNRATVLKYS